MLQPEDTTRMPIHTTAQVREIAQTIQRQIGIGALMCVGAHNLSLSRQPQGSGLSMRARLHREGQTRVKIMTIRVLLDQGWDAYTIQVADKTTGAVVRTWERLYFDDLPRFFVNLDTNGF